MNKIILAGSITAALLFTLATGMATAPTNSPSHYVFGHHGSVLAVW
jgi:hypothetical protein